MNSLLKPVRRGSKRGSHSPRSLVRLHSTQSMLLLHGPSLVSGPVGSYSLLPRGSGQDTDTRNALRNFIPKGHLASQHGPGLVLSRELLRPSFICQELCQYLPCPGIECSKVQVSRPMYNDQLSSMPMVVQKCIWKLPFRHFDCKAGYRWPLR